MAGFYPIIQGFTAGVLSRRVWGRTLSDVYANALEFCRNWIISPQGSVRKRAGSEFIAELDGNTCTLATFNRDSGDDLVAAFLDTTVRLVSASGLEIDTVDLVKNGTFTATPNPMINWGLSRPGAIPLDPTPSYNNSAEYAQVIQTVYGSTFNLMMVSFNDSSHPTTWARMKQTIPIPIPAASHKFSVYVEVPAMSSANGCVLAVRLGTADNLANILNYKVNLTAAGFPRTLVTHTFVPAVANVYFWIEIINPFQPNYGLRPNVLINNVSLLGDSAANAVSLAHPYSSTEAKELQFAMDSTKRELYVVHGNHYPRKLFFDTATNKWKFDPMVFYETTVGTGAAYSPPKWGTGSFPKAVALHQARLWFANTTQAPSGVWATKIGNYGVLKVPATGALPADPLAFELSSPVSITWIQSHKILLIGTDNSEWVLSAQGGTVTGADFQFSQQSYQGSVALQPPEIGIGLAYIAPNARRIRFMQDGGDSVYGWVSRDISLKLSHDIGSSVVDIAYCLEPNYLLFVLLNDGSMLTCTFAPDMELVAWGTYSADCPIISITQTQDTNSNYLFMAKKRDAGVIAIERTNPPIINEVCLDAYASAQVATDTLTSVGANLAFAASGILDGRNLVFDGAIRAVVAESVTSFIIAGEFTKINNQSYSRIARFNFITGSFEALGTGCNGTVRALAFDPATNRLYVGGDFTTANGVTVNRITYWDGSTFVAMQSGVNNDVHSIAVHPSSGHVFIGGIFTSTVAPVVATVRIAEWTGAAWIAIGTGASAVVRALYHDGTFLYAGGDFVTMNAVAANFIARYNGAVWSALGTGADAAVHSIVPQGTNIFFGGDFTAINAVASVGVMRWNGTVFTAVGGGLATGVRVLAEDGVGGIVAGGIFTAPFNKIARFDGVNWIVVNDGLIATAPQGVLALYVVTASIIAMGGNFTGITGYSQRIIYGFDHLDGKIASGIAISNEMFLDFLANPFIDGRLREIESFYTKSEPINNKYFRSIPPHAVLAGAIPIDSWVTDTVLLGLPYIAALKTVPLEGGNQAGTSQGGRNRWPKIFARIFNSCMPSINGYVPTVPAEQLPSWGDPNDAVITGDFDISSEGFDRASAVEIVAQSNLRTEIAGIFGKATSNNV